MFDRIIMHEYGIICDEKPHTSLNMACYWISKQCFRGAVSWRYIRDRIRQLV